MPDLTRELRRSLENTIKAARVSAETGAEEALRRLGVGAAVLPAHMEARRAERNRLRAHARSLGDALHMDETQETKRLAEAAAYVQWHRLLFARFLVERGLLRDEDGIVVSLADCREEAAMAGAGDEWSVAAGHAARLLPGVFPPDDPVESLVLAPEHSKALRDHLKSLDVEIFRADDSLGWTYQFWRAAEKKAINENQGKIGAAELPAVTQLFTEPYMVRFLLHNTLGAWWAGKVLAEKPALAKNAADESALRAACAVPGYNWDFLRFVQEDGVWWPAAGVYAGWPVRAAEITVLDPCCGSGHFLTEVLTALAAVRVAEEGLSPANAVVAVLRENLHGLEIDGRCVQIAAFNLALTAWRIGGAGIVFPTPHVAWVGAPPPLPKSEFAALANGDLELRRGLEALHDLFSQAPLLGSLIEPIGGDLVSPMRIARIEESVEALVKKMRNAEPERAEGAIAARGMADAAAILARRFTLLMTNVPFLGRGKQDIELATNLATRFDIAKTDLATAMLYRMVRMIPSGGSIASVSLENWLFLKSYKAFRAELLSTVQINALASLGEEAWDYFGDRGPLAVLSVLSKSPLVAGSNHVCIDTKRVPLRHDKATHLASGALNIIKQVDQIHNIDLIISTALMSRQKLLSAYCRPVEGLSTGDSDRFVRSFWEINWKQSGFVPYHATPDTPATYSGLSQVLLWEEGQGTLSREPGARIQGHSAWKQPGLIVGMMRHVPVSIYLGEIHEKITAALIPQDEKILSAIYEFVASDTYRTELRKVDHRHSVATATLVKVPFDLTHWRSIAAEKYPEGLPLPYSDDPTQWLFHSHPRYSESGTELHVALARLAGYRWPAETDTEMRLSSAARALIAKAAMQPASESDGLLALVPARGERALADRLLTYLAACWGDSWRVGLESELITAACERTKEKPPAQLNLNAWLRTHAARQHAKLFHDRPFLWWISDGRTDGFTAIVNYHRLNRTNLERLAYTVLGDWIARLGDDPRQEAARVLQAKLGKILEGEKPYDIFVRWKPIDQQPLGWEPDLDDGVRLNIRPFIEAKILSHEPNVKYGVDRGTDVKSAPWFHLFGGRRVNDHHTTRAEKHAARAKKSAA